MMAGYMLVFQDLSSFIFYTRSSGTIGVAVYSTDRRSLPANGSMSLLMISYSFSTCYGFCAVSKSWRSSNRTRVGLIVPCFAPRIPDVTPRQVMMEPDVLNGVPSSLTNVARIIAPAFFYMFVALPLYSCLLLNAPLRTVNGRQISG